MLVENPQTEKERLLDTGTRRESDVENHSAIKPKKKNAKRRFLGTFRDQKDR